MHCKAAAASWLPCAAGNSAVDVVRNEERAAEPWIWLNPVESTLPRMKTPTLSQILAVMLRRCMSTTRYLTSRVLTPAVLAPAPT
jgi:hypothetical protein